MWETTNGLIWVGLSLKVFLLTFKMSVRPLYNKQFQSYLSFLSILLHCNKTGRVEKTNRSELWNRLANRGQQFSASNGDGSKRTGRNVCGRPTSITLSTPILLVKIANIHAYSTCQHAINAISA